MNGTVAEAATHLLPAPTVTSTALPSATVAASYSTTLLASGGTAPYSWSLASGAVPLGLVLSSSGTLIGIPELAATSTLSVRVTDALGAASVAAVTLLVHPAPAPPELVSVVTAAGQLVQEEASSQAISQSTLPAAPIVAAADVANGHGGWVVSSRGVVSGFGGAQPLGGLSTRRARSGVVGIAANLTGTGYWIATADGFVGGFGSVHASGRLRGLHRADAVVAIAAATHGGYYLLQRNGVVTGFGGARALGSLHARREHVVPVAISATPSGSGYWIATASGAIFRYGVARRWHLAGEAVSGTVVAMARASDGTGLYLLNDSGAIFPFGAVSHLAPMVLPAGDHAVAIAAAV
jgi:hypothetical protein